MAWRLRPEDVTALARGCALLGSGGGGATTMVELMLADDGRGERLLESVEDLDPATPCFGAAFVGSTILLGERMPDLAPFAHLVAAAERWLGLRIPAVCSIEGGGMNSLVPLLFAGERTIVDADCTGRAVPELDQMSLFVDGVPGLVFTCDSGAGGVALVETDRAVDAERIIRSAIIQAGGTGAAVLAGFTVGDLREHALPGHQRRALGLGRAFLDALGAPIPALADALGARLLTEGRIDRIAPYAGDPHVQTVEIGGPGGSVDRVVTRSETLAVLRDGRLLASAPAIIVVLDAVSREILEVTDLAPGRRVAVLSLPAPDWWVQRPERLRRVLPSTYGLRELDAA
ncbi:S-methyl thiohydantoin desulfurase domain-containing protein [Microbacterium xylanilyticum]